MTDPPIAIPTGEELYDMLMGRIEPDLQTKNLSLLEKKYAGETSEQSKQRAQRYEKAFAEYEKQLSAYLSILKGKVHDFQSSARQSLEHEAREKEEKALGSLEDRIQQL